LGIFSEIVLKYIPRYIPSLEQVSFARTNDLST